MSSDDLIDGYGLRRDHRRWATI